ncbi:DUF3644 domain-containing protein [Kitasatospora sp. NPDC088346]|uniref:DUF3644 domain-containing protein n=1 Tax=Kitasatospora sp. NPDC088346 TaxID=3364073 RepID=UPI0038102DE2
MAKPRWHHMLMQSQRHALKAVDEWNCSGGDYGDFLTHMHKAWHYLLHAEFHKDGVDYHYRDPKTGRHAIVDGEPKAWALEDCLKRRYPNSADPVRLNAELFVQLRNKVEHRYEHGLKVVTGGKAQALVFNFEHEMVSHFGPLYSLADRLRFPISLQQLTAAGRDELRAAAAKLPRRTRDLVARYEAVLDQEVLDDLQYDYRVRLVPIVGPKTDADLAINFVRLDELTEDERKIMTEAGRNGTVLVRDRQVEVADKGKLLPGKVVELVDSQVPFDFKIHHHTELWHRLGVRKPKGAAKPYDTDARYCVYSEAFGNYVYTDAWVKRIITEVGTPEKYRAFFGGEPQGQVVQLPGQSSGEHQVDNLAQKKSA